MADGRAGLDATAVAGWVREWAADVRRDRDRLIDLDRQIGDADHGANLDRGLTAVVAKLDEAGPLTQPGQVLKLVATTLISTVGGAAGPLYGTAFLRAASAAGDSDTLDAAGVVSLLGAARDGIVARGKAVVEDKTMVDAWEPAVTAAQQALDRGADLPGVIGAAAEAASEGAAATVPLVARKGRASYLGERSAGHLDPGAASTDLLLQALARSVR
jgi:phosphoenolpyruvate---glycerone phosphotransferase subunit DhaL